jgi:hypothetical protein
MSGNQTITGCLDTLARPKGFRCLLARVGRQLQPRPIANGIFTILKDGLSHYLLAFGGGVALADPVGPKVVSDVQYFHVSEASSVQLVVRRTTLGQWRQGQQPQ